MNMLLVACEDVIQIDVPTTTPKLVIEASINWFKGTVGNFQAVKLSLSTPYFDTETLPANNAKITITDTSNNTFFFIENEATGIYMTYDFIPKINETYTLTITYQNETYVGVEVLKTITPVTRVEQENDTGFSGDETQLKAYYNDPEDEENYYFFEFVNDKNSLVDLGIYNDEFTNGNEVFAFFSKEDLKPDDEIIIRNYGVSKRFYEYIYLLLQQKSNQNGSPFETQPTSIRGNCVNTTHPDNYPFGYFRLSQADQFIYTIQ